MIIDEKGKLFGKISVVDILVVLIFAVAIGGFIYKFTAGNDALRITADSPITMTLRIKAIRQFAVDAVDIGDEIYERNGPILGRVVSVKSDGYRDTFDLNDGTQAYGDVENRYNLYITLESVGRISDDGYFINGSRQVAVGSEIKIRSDKINADSSVYELVAG